MSFLSSLIFLLHPDPFVSVPSCLFASFSVSSSPPLCLPCFFLPTSLPQEVPQELAVIGVDSAITSAASTLHLRDRFICLVVHLSDAVGGWVREADTKDPSYHIVLLALPRGSWTVASSHSSSVVSLTKEGSLFLGLLLCRINQSP